MIFGVDISVFQGLEIDYAKAAASGIYFAIVKTSEGAKGLDADRLQHIAGFRAVGVRVGVYHFGRVNQGTGDEQAEEIFEACGDTMPDFFVLDLEANNGHPVADVLQFVRDFIAGCESRFGRKPLLYTGPWFVEQMGPSFAKASDLADCPLWISAYTHGNAFSPGPKDAPPKMPPWPSWAIWQFSGGGTVPGIPTPVDRDIFNGTEDDFREQICGLPPLPPTVPSLPPVA